MTIVDRKSLLLAKLLLIVLTGITHACPRAPLTVGSYYYGVKEVGMAVVFSGAGSMCHYGNLNLGYTPHWEWDFDYQGSFNADIGTTNPYPTWTYAQPGTYTVAVYFYDQNNWRGNLCTFQISILNLKRYYYLTDHLGSVRATVQGGQTMLTEGFEGDMSQWTSMYGGGYLSYTGTLTNNIAGESLLLSSSVKELNDGIATVDVKWSSLTASSSFVLRYQNSFYYTVDVYQDHIAISKKRPWDNTVEATGALLAQPVSGQWYRLQVTADSNRIFVYWNQQFVTSWQDNDSPMLSGKVGFRQSGMYTVFWDNLTVTTGGPGKIATSDDYDAWGMQLDGRSTNIADANPKYKFTGKERDVETSYDYFGARYYDARIGRWLSVDPLVEKYPGWSPFAYCTDNPIMHVDIHGDSVADWWAVFLQNIATANQTSSNQPLNGGSVFSSLESLVKSSISRLEEVTGVNLPSLAENLLVGAALPGLGGSESTIIGVTESEAKALAGQFQGITINGEQAVSSIEAFGSRAGSTFRGAPPSVSSDLDIFVTLNSNVVNSPELMKAVNAEVDEIEVLWNSTKGFSLNALRETDLLAPKMKAQLLQTPFIPLSK